MKILVADDSSFHRLMLLRMLEAWGYEVVLAADGHEAQRILDTDDSPQLAILDCMMPGVTGLELCEQIRARKQVYVYTILVSSADHDSDVLKGFELGADDYLCKPFKEIELRTRLKVGERIIRSKEEVADAHEAMKFEASHDSLLRIWNRRAITDLLIKELNRARRSQAPLSVFIADLDFFQRVNDSCGHLAGDDVLRFAADRTSSAVRDYDHVGRYGDDEFLAVLPSSTAKAAREVAERVRKAIGAEPFANDGKMTFSIGVSQWHSGQDVHGLLRNAEMALHRAKQSGRNRVEVGTQESPNEDVGDAKNSTSKRGRIRRSGLDQPLQVQIFQRGKLTLIHGRMRDISEDGMGAEISCSLHKNDHVTLTFSLDDGQECTVPAVVQQCQGFRCGFEFVSIHTPLRESIARMCQ